MRKDQRPTIDPNWRQRLAYRLLLIAWVANAALLIAAFAWTYFDGRSLLTIDTLRGLFGFRPQHSDLMVPDSSRIQFSVQTAMAFGAVFVSSLGAIFVGLIIGRWRFRTMCAWLLFMTLACGWLGFFASWPEVYWIGQQRRVAADLAAAGSLAEHLRSNWPREDGNLDDIGPFLAYPQGAPTTVLPLKTITFPDTTLGYSAIERTSDGAMRFELTGSEAGAWLEWRADGSQPSSFVSGLKTNYSLSRQQELAPAWFLVRYRAIASGSTL